MLGYDEDEEFDEEYIEITIIDKTEVISELVIDNENEN